MPVRDIFLNEYKVLKNHVLCGFYIMAVVIFMTHAAEFDMIHPPDVVEKYAPEESKMTKKMIPQKEGCTMEEVTKYNKKGDVWVVLSGSLLNVSTFLSQHLVGELAIPTSEGKEATAKSDMIHPPAVAEKYAPDAFIGVTGSGKAKKWKGVVRSVPVVADKGDAFASLEVGRPEDGGITASWWRAGNLDLRWILRFGSSY